MLESSSFHSSPSPNPGHRNSMHHHDAPGFEGRNALGFLLRDLLMNIFTFLDAQSLASFSETARRPNFECFYFLELQLKRALLVGDSLQIEGDDEEEELGGGADRDDAGVVDGVHEDMVGIEIGNDDGDVLFVDPAQQAGREHAQNEEEIPDDEEDSSKGRKGKRISTIPSFEGSVAGTGVISRLAFLDSHSARRIVQAYLDSNASVRATAAGNKPTGCVGTYARAVRAAASEVTRLVKAERRCNFDALPADRQHELSARFIQACTSDDTLHVVKEILQKNGEMDVDRFVLGPDDTETCALHAAAFNGAERVLEFLCGGIDERRPGCDGGACDVNVRDANGWTALHFAAGTNSVTSVRVLSEHGSELAVEAGNGYTPYHWAERLSNEEAKDELGKLGADSRFVGGWMFGSSGRGLLDLAGGDSNRRIPFVSFLANQFFAFSGR